MSRVTDATAVLAAERLEPLTAAEHAAARHLEAEYARDVARSCTCVHQWDTLTRRYVRIGPVPGCVWHTRKAED